MVENGLTRLVCPEIGRSSGRIIVDVRKTNSCINGFRSGTETKIEVRRACTACGLRWIGGRHRLKHIVVHENAVSVLTVASLNAWCVLKCRGFRRRLGPDLNRQRHLTWLNKDGVVLWPRPRPTQGIAARTVYRRHTNAARNAIVGRPSSKLGPNI